MSVYGSILTACKSLILTIPGVTSGQVKIRKRPVFIAGVDTLPFYCLSPRRRVVRKYVMKDTVEYGYPVLVTYWQEAKFDFETVEAELAAFEAVAGKLMTLSLSGVPTVTDFKYDPQPDFDLPAVDAAFDLSAQEFTYISQQLWR